MSFSIKIKGLDILKQDLDRLGNAFEDTKTISAGIEYDTEGYLDRQCPNTECMRAFKVYQEDYLKISELHCPYCNYINSDTGEWLPEEQKDLVFNQMKKEVSKVIDTMGRYRIRSNMNIPALECLITKDKCKKCHCRYAYIGINSYCPSCGNIKINYQEQLEKIEKNISILKAVVLSIDIDSRQNLLESTLENSIKDVVEIFQVNATKLFKEKDLATALKKNIFQNLIDGSKVWATSVYNQDYQTLIGQDKFERLNVIFQKRHLLVHTQGIVDQEYIDKTADNSIKIGMRITISERDVHEEVDLVRQLLDKLTEIVEDLLIE